MWKSTKNGMGKRKKTGDKVLKEELNNPQNSQVNSFDRCVNKLFTGYPKTYKQPDLFVNIFHYFIDNKADLLVGTQAVGDLVPAIYYGAVISAAEEASDFGLGVVGHLSTDIHGDLPGEGDVHGPALCAKIFNHNIEVACYFFLNQFAGDNFLTPVGKYGREGFDALIISYLINMMYGGMSDDSV